MYSSHTLARIYMKLGTHIDLIEPNIFCTACHGLRPTVSRLFRAVDRIEVTIMSQSYSATNWQQEVCHFQNVLNSASYFYPICLKFIRIMSKHGRCETVKRILISKILLPWQRVKPQYSFLVILKHLSCLELHKTQHIHEY